MTPMTFDIIVLGLVAFSCAVGAMRGFCREVFTIVGWIAGIVATIYFTPVFKPIGRNLISSEWIADLATASVIFLATMAIFSFLSNMSTKTLDQSALSIVDRAGGFGFGILRAVVLLGLAFLLFSYVYEPENRPEFVQNAKTTAFLETSASFIQDVAPIWEEKIRVSVKDELPPATKIEGLDQHLTEEQKAEKKKMEQTERVLNLGTRVMKYME